MLRREGSHNRGEKPLSPAEQHRSDGLKVSLKYVISVLETQFGPDVVDDATRAAELREEIRARVASSQKFVPLTPDILRQDRQMEFGEQAQPVTNVPISDMVNLSTDPSLHASQPNDLAGYAGNEVVMAAEQIARDAAVQQANLNRDGLMV